MAPNSEEGGRLQNALFINSLWSEDTLSKEKQRPPIYNPEDYALSLKKWSKRPTSGLPSLYGDGPPSEPGLPRSPQAHGTTRDYRNLMLTSPANGEMTLRQFGTVSELLSKLRADLRLAFPSFVQEFISDPLDGISLLLELLRTIQLSQAGGGVTGPAPGSGPNLASPGSGSCAVRVSPAAQRRALLDELACLHCLLCCCHRYQDAIRRLVDSSTGLFTLAVCIMSNVNKSRIIALELLTKVCDPPSSGHSAVSEALSTLRLRFGEPVRFRFLAGMLCSGGGGGDLLTAGLKFLNTFLETADTSQHRLYVQAELQQAGFDIQAIKKIINMNATPSDLVLYEIERWDKGHIDIETITLRLKEAEKSCEILKDKVKIIEKRVKILQEEKGVLVSLEQCLKEKCCDLQDEVNSLKTGKPKTKKRTTNRKIDDSSPAEDEGISSSERSLTPENDIQRERDASVYEIFSVQSETRQKPTEKEDTLKKNLSDEEEETTIEEVMEELQNIINDAETEQYEAEKKEYETKQIAEKLKMRVELIQEENEDEIVPENLHPQPPRKTRSLVHLYIPTEDYDYHQKELLFGNEIVFTSDGSSDSLLSTSKCHQIPEKDIPITSNNNREILNTIMEARERAIIQEKRRQKKTEMIKALKRSESFHHSNVKLLELNETNLKTVKHNSFDGMFFVTNFSNAPSSPRHSRKKCKEDFAKQKLKSKSLDRIDDGLDSMVDIVVTSEQNLNQRLHTKSDSGHVTETSISRSTSNNYSQTKNETKFPSNVKYEDKHRMFLPCRYDNREYYKEPHFYFPRIQESPSNSFLIKRGHTNAGLYSGYNINRQSPMGSKRTIVTANSYKTTNNRKANTHGKFTDLPSGLY